MPSLYDADCLKCGPIRVKTGSLECPKCGGSIEVEPIILERNSFLIPNEILIKPKPPTLGRERQN